MLYDIKCEIRCHWMQNDCISRLLTSLLLFISNGRAKRKLAILAFLYCKEFEKISNSLFVLLHLFHCRDDHGYVKGLGPDLIHAVCEISDLHCKVVWDRYENCWNTEVGRHGAGGIGKYAITASSCLFMASPS